jgi:hypothetical protein
VLLDGDEAIVALMSKHLLEGKEFALFFYGQSYGLSILESCAGALSFALFGETALSLNIAMLTLWCGGWVFFTLALDHFVNRLTALGASLLLIFCPAWGAWSLMARGGYITAFVLTSVGLFLCAVTAQSTRPKPVACGFIGVVLLILLFSQPIFAVPFVSYVVFLHLARRQTAEVLATVAGLSVALVVVLVSVGGGWSGYWSPDVFGPAGFVDSITNLPRRLFVFFGGAYYYDIELPAGTATRACAAVWCLLLALAFSSFAFQYTRVRRSYLAFASLTSVALVLGLVLLVDGETFGFRYLLPIAGPLVLCLAAVADRLDLESRGRGVALPLVLVGLLCGGALAHIDARQHSRFGTHIERLATEQANARLIRSLVAQDIHHVYCLDPMFQWNIVFESGENILARWLHRSDRYPEYPAAVDEALFASRPVALVGWREDLASIREIARRAGVGIEARTVGNHYFFRLESTDPVRRVSVIAPPAKPGAAG